MATQALKGDARFDFTPDGGSPETFTLALPLREFEPVDVRPRFEWWSGDRTTREVVLLGDGVKDLMATIRADDEPAELKRMLRLALEQDLTLTYRETAGGTAFPVKLVAVVGASGSDKTPIRPDRDRKGFGEYEARIHIRRVDGGDLDGLL